MELTETIWLTTGETIQRSVTWHPSQPMVSISAWPSLIGDADEPEPTPPPRAPEPTAPPRAPRETSDNDVWIAIRSTNRLADTGAMEHLGYDGRMWVRIPLVGMRPISREHNKHFQTQTEFLESWDHQRVYPTISGTFKVWHSTKVVNLFEAGHAGPDSRGMLTEGGLRHGMQHGDGCGVYCYAYWPESLFTAGDGYALLEVESLPYLTRVKHGAGGRYVIKRSPYEGIWSPCHNVTVVALWFLKSVIPQATLASFFN